MNKTIIIAGGASIASLAVGATSGYFFAQKKLEKAFYEKLDEVVTREVDAVTKRFSILLDEERKGKPASPQDIISKKPEAVAHIETPALDDFVEKQRKKNAEKAMVDYRGYAPADGAVVESNIFDQSTVSKKPPLPPRDPSGRWAPRQQGSSDRVEDEPYVISDEDFLKNELGYDQESLLYFVNNNALLNASDTNEHVELDCVGEDNLQRFPEEAGPNGSRSICVRNEKLRTEWDITITPEDLTEYLGLGDESVDPVGEEADDDGVAEYASREYV